MIIITHPPKAVVGRSNRLGRANKFQLKQLVKVVLDFLFCSVSS